MTLIAMPVPARSSQCRFDMRLSTTKQHASEQINLSGSVAAQCRFAPS
jgi:hypothetical protein